MMSEYIKVIGESTDRELVGGKGGSLSVMHNLGLPVPPGFTITTEAWRALNSGNLKFADLWKDIAEQMKVTFPEFGEGQLVSVRSGAAQSMPGMMDTILNVGVSPDDHPLLRYNFWKSFCLALGVDRESIQRVTDDMLVKRGAFFLSALGSSDVSSVIGSLSSLAKETGSIPQTKMNLLKRAVQIVFDSWNSERAVAYREQFGISHDGGTACTIQLIVSGLSGGSGVYLTRNPQTGVDEPYIDWAEDAQGDAVVDGSVMPATGERLKASKPKLYQELIGVGARLEREFKDAMDIEFTISKDKLYILQCRAMKRTPTARARIALDMVLDGIADAGRVREYNDPPVISTRVETATTSVPFTTSLPIVPMIVRGRITLAEKPEPGLVMVRKNNTTEDLPHMLKAAAILTIVGGPTCHAALVARESNIPAYVGMSGCYIEYGKLKTSTTFLKEGDLVTILPDGRIYAGDIETVEVSEMDRNSVRLENLKKLLEASHA